MHTLHRHIDTSSHTHIVVIASKHRRRRTAEIPTPAYCTHKQKWQYDADCSHRIASLRIALHVTCFCSCTSLLLERLLCMTVVARVTRVFPNSSITFPLHTCTHELYLQHFYMFKCMHINMQNVRERDIHIYITLVNV